MMVKKFAIVLNPPPQGGYSPNSDMTGYDHLDTDKVKYRYDSINVTLRGCADVLWMEQSLSPVTFHSHEDYIKTRVSL